MSLTATLKVTRRLPYRLDLTVDALRRLAANVVDTVDERGVYRRALCDRYGANVLHVSQSGSAVHIRIDGPKAKRWLPAAHRMLGFDADLTEWYERTRAFPWLAYLTDELRGLRPPRYPSLWEALAHAIVFQQISIHAAASIMRRLVEAFGAQILAGERQLFAFPQPESILLASQAQLRSAGLSANKIAHLQSAAQSVLGGEVEEAGIDALPTPQAAEVLTRVRGIGPWSAAVVLLRGFGRLDVFPMNDSGVARTIKSLSGDREIELGALLDALGPVRGMLYFHLLLGRIRNIVQPS